MLRGKIFSIFVIPAGIFMAAGISHHPVKAAKIAYLFTVAPR